MISSRLQTTVPVQTALDSKRVWQITGWLLVAVGTLLVMHIVRLNTPRDMSFQTLRMVIDKFHLDREGNIPAWFSSTMLSAAAALMIFIGVQAQRAGQGFARRWIAMGVIFVLLSMDETASFHEMLIYPLRERLNVIGGIFYFTWIVPALMSRGAVRHLPAVPYRAARADPVGTCRGGGDLRIRSDRDGDGPRVAVGRGLEPYHDF